MKVTAWKVPIYGVFSGPYFAVLALEHLFVFSRNAGKYGPEKTPLLDTFHAVSYAENWTFLTVINLNATMSTITELQKQPSRVVLRKIYSENMQQIFKKTPMPRCDLNKDAKASLLKSHLIWLLTCKFAAYFQNTFS